MFFMNFFIQLSNWIGQVVGVLVILYFLFLGIFLFFKLLYLIFENFDDSDSIEFDDFNSSEDDEFDIEVSLVEVIKNNMVNFLRVERFCVLLLSVLQVNVGFQ